MVIVAHSNSMPWLRRVRFWALALVGLVVGHEAVYLAAYGAHYGSVMASTGHDYWLTFALITLGLGGTPLAAAAVGLFKLRIALRAVVAESRQATGATASERTGGDITGPSYASEVIGLLPRLILAIVGGFVVQENLESELIGHGLPGLWPLNGGVVLPVLLGVAALLALAGAWLRWRQFVLEQRLAAVRAGTARDRAGATRTPARWREVAAAVAYRWLIARRLAGRAPPRPLPA